MKKSGILAVTPRVAIMSTFFQRTLISTTSIVVVVVVVAAAVFAVVTSAAKHPALPLDPRFRSHLKCPYADRWLAKGPEQAALELGLDLRTGRKLQAADNSNDNVDNAATKITENIQGSCTFPNAFTGAIACLQFNGPSWTPDEMTARCAEERDSTLLFDEGCTAGEGEELGGWCTRGVSEGKMEATAMILSSMANCANSEMACKTFMGGSFIADGSCSTAAGDDTISGGGPTGVVVDGNSSALGPPPGVVVGGGSSDTEGPKCLLAPGAIGAAHQAGYSKGYSANCPGTPAEGSPYMWPLSWAADTEAQSMAYGSDEVIYTSRGRTYYALDKNWKRSDTTFQEGKFRTIGQDPCEEIDQEFAEEGFLGCIKNQTDGSVTTMIHRENLMYFIHWKEEANVTVGETDASKINNCTMINLAVIGNIRPDWFMDKRGDDTDVQYLGDQHVFYADAKLPKLVKQWKKQDFASQYFVMSMMANPPNKLAKDESAPVEANMHWPLILNIPGEGFGDDSLRIYKNHRLLTENDDHLFKLIENYEALGEVCQDVRGFGGEGEGGGDVGPPVLDESEKIPSNLEVDPLSWVSKEVTFSPIWMSQTTEMVSTEDSAMKQPTADSSGKAVLEVNDRITVESCYDEATMMVDISVYFHDIEPTFDGMLPWMAIGYRPSELCSMTPPKGGNTPIILVTQVNSETAPKAYSTELVPEAKALSEDAFRKIYMGTRPMGEAEGYKDVSVEAPTTSSNDMAQPASIATEEDTVSVHYKQMVDGNDTLHLMYAIGMTSKLGIHSTRGCFEIQPTPCGGSSMNNLMPGGNNENEVTGSTTKPIAKSTSSANAANAIDIFMALSVVTAVRMF